MTATTSLVRCARCQHDTPADAKGHALGCAVRPQNGGLVGGYGSVRHDMRAYTILSPRQVPLGMLCDGCVDVLLDTKAIAPHAHESGATRWDSLGPKDAQALLDVLDEVYARFGHTRV